MDDDEDEITEEERQEAYRNGVYQGIKYAINAINIVREKSAEDGYAEFSKSLRGLVTFLEMEPSFSKEREAIMGKYKTEAQAAEEIERMNGTEHTEDGNEEVCRDDSAKAESPEARKLNEQTLFIDMFNKQQAEVHDTALNKGWWEGSDDVKTAMAMVREHVPSGEIRERAMTAVFNISKRNEGEMIALMHSELSEALEALRHGNPPDDKLKEFDSLTVELADVLIRMMDFAEYHKLPLAEAVIAKMDFNRGRSYKHGKQF